MMEVGRTRFTSMVGAIGTDTLMAMAKAGPEMQIKLPRRGCGSTLISDGNSPINLFQTATDLSAASDLAAERWGWARCPVLVPRVLAVL
jgi:major vault protein